MKKIISIFFIVLLLAVTACNGDNGSAAGKRTFTAQAGYEYDLSANFSADAKVTDKNGNSLKVEYGKVFFGEIGTYYVKDGNSNSEIIVVDSEAPMFLPLWEEYEFTKILPVNVAVGSIVDLNDIFVAKDNYDKNPTTLFKVKFQGYEDVELEDGSKFRVENGEYVVEAYAKDAYGNASYMRQKLTPVYTEESMKAEYGEFQYALRKTTKLDGVVTIPTNLPVGTNVNVKGKVLLKLDYSSSRIYFRVWGYECGAFLYYGHYSPNYEDEVWIDFNINTKVSQAGSEPYGPTRISSTQTGISFFALDILENDWIIFKDLTVSAL